MSRPISTRPLAATIALVLASTGLLALPAAAQNPREPINEVDPKRPLPQNLGVIAPMLVNEKQPFGKTKDGKEVTVFTLENGRGTKVRLIDYGATLISVETPDRNGKTANITLGFPKLDGY